MGGVVPAQFRGGVGVIADAQADEAVFPGVDQHRRCAGGAPASLYRGDLLVGVHCAVGGAGKGGVVGVLTVSLNGFGGAVEDVHIVLHGLCFDGFGGGAVHRFRTFHRPPVDFRIRVAGRAVPGDAHLREQQDLHALFMGLFDVIQHAGHVGLFISPNRGKVYHAQLPRGKGVADIGLFQPFQAAELGGQGGFGRDAGAGCSHPGHRHHGCHGHRQKALFRSDQQYSHSFNKFPLGWGRVPVLLSSFLFFPQKKKPCQIRQDLFVLGMSAVYKARRGLSMARPQFLVFSVFTQILQKDHNCFSRETFGCFFLDLTKKRNCF